jgi:ABC-type glycerol-3-phosphate transport system substrate-binding protein
MTDVSGNIWGVPRLGVALNVHPTWWRTDWLKEFDLPIPSTLEEAEKTFETFRKKYTDCIILTSSLSDLRTGTVGGFTQWGDSRWIDPKDGMLKHPILQPDYKDWVAKMNEWYKKGWLFKEAFGTFDVPEVAKTGKVGMYVGWYSRVTILIQQILSAVPGMYFDFNPKGLKGPKGFMNTFRLGGTSAIMVTKKCKDPEAAVRLINWQVQDVANFLTAYYGIPDKDWKWDDAENAKYGKKYYINRLITPETPGAKIYAGEFVCSSGPVTEPQFAPNDAQWRRHYEYIRDWNYNLDIGKMPPDVGVPYDVGSIRKSFPGLADLERLVDEETVKFITGVRPLTEWDAFQKQLDAAGMQEWIKAYTAEYKKYKK